MEGIELVAFEIISNVGMAKSLAVEALRDVRQGKYEESEAKLAEAAEFLTNGHHAHTSLIQKEAAGEKTEFSILFVHAQDHLMTAISEKNLIEQIIELTKVVNTLK